MSSKRIKPRSTFSLRTRPKDTPSKSLWDIMEEGCEFMSALNHSNRMSDARSELERGLNEWEQLRNRACLVYAGNMISRTAQSADIGPDDQRLFQELVNSIPANHRKCDLLLITPGGLVDVANTMVDALRRRFDEVDVVIPRDAMSAGTLIALAADQIWMDKDSALGPIDPQIVTTNGRLAPAEGILVTFREIVASLDHDLAQKRPVSPSLWEFLHRTDRHEIGAAFQTISHVRETATRYLVEYKFRSWATHSSTSLPVTEEEKRMRAMEISALLCSNEKWKSHGRRIGPEEMTQIVRVRIARLEDTPSFYRVVRKFAALLDLLFRSDSSNKVFLARDFIVNVKQR